MVPLSYRGDRLFEVVSLIRFSNIDPMSTIFLSLVSNTMSNWVVATLKIMPPRPRSLTGNLKFETQLDSLQVAGWFLVKRS